MKKRLVVANWKMYIESQEEAVALARELRTRMRSIKEVDVRVAPPFVLLPAVVEALNRSTIMVGAQAVSRYHADAHTGDISAAMLKDAGASFVIVGHSERRAAGETEEIIQKQLAEVGEARLSAILCVGEKERDAAGDYFEVIKAQLSSALTNISKKSLSKLVIAYEPVWAIGKTAEDAMKPSEVQETIIFIKKTITDLLGRSAANKIPILYGGSVEEANAPALLKEGGVSGFLVGGTQVPTLRRLYLSLKHVSSMQIRSIKDAAVAQKRVLLRMSLNVPVDAKGNVADLFRLKRSLPTLEYLLQRKAKVVIVGYFGRSGETLQPVFDALHSLLPQVAMKFFSGTPEEALAGASALQEGEVLVLENIRKHPGEEKNDPKLAAALAALGEVYIDDAFAEAHRAYASNVGVAKLLPSYAGFLMEEEVAKLSAALTPPQGAIAIIGGAKFETKQPLIEKLLTLYSRVLVGGALGNDFIKARGLPFGASLTSSAPVPEAIAANEKLLSPNDAVFAGGAKEGRTSFVADTRADEKIVDIGPETAIAWSKVIAQAPFVLWNGPLGMYEKGFTHGTDALAGTLASSATHAVVGGGDTAAAIAKFTFEPERVFVSSGGGAMLEFLN